MADAKLLPDSKRKRPARTDVWVGRCPLLRRDRSVEVIYFFLQQDFVESCFVISWRLQQDFLLSFECLPSALQQDFVESCTAAWCASHALAPSGVEQAAPALQSHCLLLPEQHLAVASFFTESVLAGLWAERLVPSVKIHAAARMNFFIILGNELNVMSD